MTPTQTAKEKMKIIFGKAIDYYTKLDEDLMLYPAFIKWLDTEEAAALLSGEDWKEDGMKWVNASKELPALEKVVFIKDDIGLERLGNFYESEEGGHRLYIQPNGAHNGFRVKDENDNFSHYNWLYDPN